jgi:hypothetical protein
MNQVFGLIIFDYCMNCVPKRSNTYLVHYSKCLIKNTLQNMTRIYKPVYTVILSLLTWQFLHGCRFLMQGFVRRWFLAGCDMLHHPAPSPTPSRSRALLQGEEGTARLGCNTQKAKVVDVEGVSKCKDKDKTYGNSSKIHPSRA